MTIFDLDSSYSEVDASNNAASPAGMPENMAPSGVNDAWRAHAGATKRAFDRDHAMSTTTVAGSANAITLAYSVAPAAYVQGQKFTFKATAANTGATTVNVNSLGALSLFKKSAAGVVACSGGEIQNGDIVEIEHDGTQFQIVGGAANAGFAETMGTIASAGTVAIGGAAANYLSVTGTTTITAFDSVLAGTRRILEFAAALTLTHNATTLILPGAANITTAAGDVAIMISEGSGNWRCAAYTKASGLPVFVGPLVKSTEYAPADQTITAGGSVTLAHGFGIRPKIIVLTLINVSTEGGYTAGQEIDVFPTGDASGTRGFSVRRDTTNIVVTYGATSLLLMDTTGNEFSITVAKWQLRVRAYA
jgi:hypothetical protein